MGIEAIYAKPRTSLPEPGQPQIYPYLLRDLAVAGPDQVWCSDITYVPMATGFMYLVAVMDWMEPLCVGLAVEQHAGDGFLRGRLGGGVAGGTAGPADFQHRSRLAVYFADVYRCGGIGGGVDVSMDGRGRWIDNRFIERLWRSRQLCGLIFAGLRRWAGGGMRFGRVV